jgi:hypothetical protein
MALRTSPGAFRLLCLAAPGNVGRELALYRRALFAAGWGPSCFALPELAVLGRLGPGQTGGLKKILASSLRGLEGDFAPASPVLQGRGLYLPLGPCLPSLAQSLLKDLSLEPQEPFEGQGIFLGLAPDGVLEGPSPILPPAISGFHSAALILLDISPPSEGLRGLSWSEALRVHRPRAGRPGRL